LSSNDVGKMVRICGWVALHRVHGGLTFLNLRDHTGIVQVLVLQLICYLTLKIQFYNWEWCVCVLIKFEI
jgi:aspartyl-tRNA synthetase